MTLDEMLVATKESGAYKVQLSEERSAEFLKRFPELLSNALCYYSILGQRYTAFWGTHIQLHGEEPVPGRK